MHRLLIALPLLLAACAAHEPSSAAPSPGEMPPLLEQRGGEYYFRLSSDGGSALAEIDAPLERVWSVLPSAYASAGIEIGTLDPRARMVGNRALTVARRLGKTPVTEYVRCAQGGSGMASVSTYRVQLSVLSTLSAGPEGGTRIATAVSATGIPNEGTSRNPIACPSTGRLEQQLADAVRAALAG